MYILPKGVCLIIGVMLYSASCGMQQAASQCSAYLLVRLHPNIGVPGTAVHWWSLLPDEVGHLYTPSRVPAQTQKTHAHTCITGAGNLNGWYREKCAIHPAHTDVIYLFCFLLISLTDSL